MNDIELNRRELTGDEALRFARESGMEWQDGHPWFQAGVGDLIRFARLVRAGWIPGGGREPNLTGGGAALSATAQQLDAFDKVRKERAGDLNERTLVYRAHEIDAIVARLAAGVPESCHQTKAVSAPSVLPPMSEE